MPRRGLEPPLNYEPEPKPDVYTNFTTVAFVTFYLQIICISKTMDNS